MKRTVRCLFVAFLIAPILSANADRLSWSKLELALREKPGLSFMSEPLLLTLENQQPGLRTNVGALTEMSVQSRYPFVAIAGLAGLIKADPEQAYRVSLHHLWGSTNIGSPVLLPFLECLTNKLAPKAFRSAFSAVALSEPRDIQSVVIVIQQIPLESLTDWLPSIERKNSSITVEALVIDRIWSSRNQLAVSQVSGVQARCKELRHYPGVPTAIYLLHCEDDSFPLVSNIEALAEDDTVDVTLKRMLFRKYARRLNGHLNVDGLAVSAKEKDRYRSWLLMYSK